MDIYVIETNCPKGFGKDYFKIRALTLSLEQFYIFTLNPSLNLVKVAGSSPLINPSKEHTDSISLANSKPVYVYKEKTLISQAAPSGPFLPDPWWRDS